jgi:hypothetical protein
MFDAIKAKLSELEGKIRGTIGQVTSTAVAAEAQVHQIGVGLSAPLDAAQAAVTKASGDITALVAPVRQRIGTLAPPGG